MRVSQQAAFVLLNRPYSESSWIVELLTRDYGRLAVIAKGARRLKSPWRGVLLPFQPLLVSWSGKGEVPTLTGVETVTGRINHFEHELTGDALICGFYCNELVTYLLHRHDPHQALFAEYEKTIVSLYSATNSSEAARSLLLRRFEKTLIKEAGYALNFALQSDGKAPIEADKFYLYVPDQGFSPCATELSRAIPGRIILSLGDQHDEGLSSLDRSLGKQLMRAILSQTLGYRRINSRELFLREAKQL